MPKDSHDQFLTFSLDKRHRITIREAELRFVYQTDGVVTFCAAEDPRRIIAYEIGELNRMNRAGEIIVQPYDLVPEHLRPGPVHDDANTFIAGLPPAQRRRVDRRYAMVRSYEDLREKGLVKRTDESIAQNMELIRTGAEDYLKQEMPDPEQALKLRNWQEGKGRKPKTGEPSKRPDACSPRALRNWVSLYRKGGKTALIDACAKRGSVRSPFNVDELALLGEVVRTEYLSLQRKPIAVVVRDVKLRFASENERRQGEGLPTLKVPGRDAVRGFIQRLDKFAVRVGRFGAEEAMRRMRTVKAGLEVSRPFERVELDEQQIDMVTILATSGLYSLFSEEELDMLGLLDTTRRWWLALAIDCRTRCIVGMTLTRDPKTSAALKCLRMVVSDKAQFADSVGALAPWSIFGRPETLATDNGPAFKSLEFTSACADLGIHALQVIGGVPGMRGRGERVFRTISTDLMSRLTGRTFSNVLERGDYASEKRAALTIEDICIALVRWAVDIYHNTPHWGLGGRTPLQQWEADIRAGNVPLHSAPSARRKHIALGVALARVLQKDGLRVMNIRYNSCDLAAFFLKHGNVELELRWNEEDLGTIEVHFDGAWRTVPASSDVFKGVHASTWLRSCRSLRAIDPKRKEWEDEVIAGAIRDIEAMNASAKAAFHIMDHAWTEKRLADLGKSALSPFDVVPTRAKTADTPDGRGQVIVPVAPADHAPAAPQLDPDRHRLPAAESAGEGAGNAPAAPVKSRRKSVRAPETAKSTDSDPTARGDHVDDDDSDGWDFEIPN